MSSTRKKSLAYVDAPLSRRWEADAQCRELAWIMVPTAAGDEITNSVADTFDALTEAFRTKQLIVHPSLLQLIETLEANIIEMLCRTADGWRKQRIANGHKHDADVITIDVGVAATKGLISSLFERMYTRITDYELIDKNNKQEKLVLLDLECLEEKLGGDIAKIVKGWK